ncbi:hypothetical protein [Paracoccus sp. (in: a-proteobacteria)]|uniref:hypothetical protein n=1 Tax=Paracoccus sp. TaxID=267 RepID=UPI00396C8757
MRGVQAAQHDAIILADDNMRYRRPKLQKVLHLLQKHDVVRPQNFFGLCHGMHVGTRRTACWIVRTAGTAQ